MIRSTCKWVRRFLAIAVVGVSVWTVSGSVVLAWTGSIHWSIALAFLATLWSVSEAGSAVVELCGPESVQS